MTESEEFDRHNEPIRVSTARDGQGGGRIGDGLCTKCARLAVCAPQHSLSDPIWYCDQFAIEPE